MTKRHGKQAHRRRRPFVRIHVINACALCGIGWAAADASGQAMVSWLGATNGSWTDAAKWSSNPNYPNNGTPPGFNYHVFIKKAATVTLDANVTVERLVLDHPDATLHQTMRDFYVTDVIDINSGHYLLNGASFITPGLMKVGGTWTITGGYAGPVYLNATGTLNASGGLLNVGTLLQVGGRANFAGAARAEFVSTTVGGSSAWNINGGTVSTGSTTFDGAAHVDHTAGRHNTEYLFLTGHARYDQRGGTLALSRSLYSGFQGAGTFVQSGGVVLQQTSQGANLVGGSANDVVGVGTMIIEGAQARFLTDGGTFATQANLFGMGTNGFGNGFIRDGATVELAGAEVGLHHGTGSLTIESGAQVTASHVRVGHGNWIFGVSGDNELRGIGTVVISGSDTRLNVGTTSGSALATLSVGDALTPAGLGAGTLLLRGGTTSVNGVARVRTGGYAEVDGATLRADALLIAGGRFDFRSGSVDVGSVETSTGGRVNLTPGRDKLLLTRGVGALAGRIDLADNAMLVDYGGASPFEVIRTAVTSGFAGGSWNGTGINSSAAAGGASTHGVGFAEASSIFASFPATYMGMTLDDTTVLIAYSRLGDANLDGVVNLADFNRLAAAFGSNDATWSHGDFNYDGAVNLIDFNLLAANFGMQTSGPTVTPQDWANLAAVVPEPGVAGAVACAAVVALAPRRRRVGAVSRRIHTRRPDPFIFSAMQPTA